MNEFVLEEAFSWKKQLLNRRQFLKCFKCSTEEIWYYFLHKYQVLIKYLLLHDAAFSTVSAENFSSIFDKHFRSAFCIFSLNWNYDLTNHFLRIKNTIVSCTIIIFKITFNFFQIISFRIHKTLDRNSLIQEPLQMKKIYIHI